LKTQQLSRAKPKSYQNFSSCLVILVILAW
jgi:hypothetical protein